MAVQIFDSAQLVPITTWIAACRDPTDYKFPELAVNGAADVTVRGDADLLALHPFRNIPILSPAVRAAPMSLFGREFATFLPISCAHKQIFRACGWGLAGVQS